MLDLKLIRGETEKVKAALGRRKENVDIDAIIAVDDKRRAVLYEVEGLKAKQNEVTKIMRRRQHQKIIYIIYTDYICICVKIYIYISFKKNKMEQKEESNKENSLKTQLFKIKEPT